MTGIVKFEDNGRFGLAWMPDMSVFNDDLGRGGGVQQAVFLTDEGRGYFIQMEQLRERCEETIGRLESELRSLKTIRGANKNLREVRAANRQADDTK